MARGLGFVVWGLRFEEEVSGFKHQVMSNKYRVSSIEERVSSIEQRGARIEDRAQPKVSFPHVVSGNPPR